MHMADALISPAVGGTAWAATAGLIGYSSRKLRDGMDDRQIPMMAVLGAFIFAAQMVNFTIPATGSSGHLGGGLILAILLGPYAGFLTLASVLIIQALFFADGGLLALGCNVINLGFFPCFIVYPLLYKKIARDHGRRWLIVTGALTAAVVSLQLGSLAVVTQTFLSGISELPFRTFVLVMQPIHLAIGLMEGAATVAVILFVLKARPEILVDGASGPAPKSPLSMKGLAVGFLIAALVTGLGLSWFSSKYPDGLEWSVLRVTGTGEVPQPEGDVHRSLADLQEKTAILPDYRLEKEGKQDETDIGVESAALPSTEPDTPLTGFVGGSLTLLLAGALWLFLKRHHLRTQVGLRKRSTPQ
jgi:cobalt/nickel transport system permease protein